jgi:hypothetical protein
MHKRYVQLEAVKVGHGQIWKLIPSMRIDTSGLPSFDHAFRMGPNVTSMNNGLWEVTNNGGKLWLAK